MRTKDVGTLRSDVHLRKLNDGYPTPTPPSFSLSGSSVRCSPVPDSPLAGLVAHGLHCPHCSDLPGDKRFLLCSWLEKTNPSRWAGTQEALILGWTESWHLGRLGSSRMETENGWGFFLSLEKSTPAALSLSKGEAAACSVLGKTERASRT